MKNTAKKEKRNKSNSLPKKSLSIKSNSNLKESFAEDINSITIIKKSNFRRFFTQYLYETSLSYKESQQSFIIPSRIREIGSFCFHPSLKLIDFENGSPNLEKVDKGAFGNTQIEYINIPLNIKPFASSQKIFQGCFKLKKIIFDHFINKEKPLIIDQEPSNEDEKDLAYSMMISQTQIQKLEVFISNINYFLFYNAPKLTEITIPKSDNSKYIKQEGCLYTKNKKKLIVAERNVKSVNVCPECQIITNYALNVKSLEKVTFDKNSQLKKISYFAFYDSNIKSIEIPDSVNDIEIGCFLNCRNLDSIKIPNSMSCIKIATFMGTNLREVTIPKSITCISCYSFYNCFQLQFVNFENDSNLTEIEDYAFSNTKIESILIPKSVKKIGNFSFAKCNNLKSINFDQQSNLFISKNGCLIDVKMSNFSYLINLKNLILSFDDAMMIFSPNSSNLFSSISSFQSSKISQLSISSTVETICPRAFAHCTNLTEVKIIDFQNSKLQKISNSAFYNCTNLAVFDIPENVNYFGLCSFKNCSKYTINIKLNNDNKITVLESAFENSGINSFNSKSKIIEVNDFAFKSCHNLIDFNAISSEKCVLCSLIFENCNALKTIKLSQNTKFVDFGDRCFMNSSIESFEVPQHLDVIPRSCFKNCIKLKNVVFHENSDIFQIHEEAFMNSSLETIFIPSKMKFIDKLCFFGCKSLKEPVFSNEIECIYIRKKAFYNSSVERINFPKGIKKIGVKCFKNCEKLKQVTFSEDSRIKTIKEKSFKSSGIESLILPSSVKLIEKEAFQNCQKFKKVNFLSDTVSISPFAFAGCNNLEEVKYDLQISIHLMINNQYPKFEKFTIDFVDEKFEKDWIEPLLVSKEPLFQSFIKLFPGYFYVINEKWNSNKSLCDKVTSLIDDVTDERFVVEKINEGYFTNKRKELVFSDYLKQSFNIIKETEIIGLFAFKFSLLKVIDFEENSNLKIIDSYAFENLQIEEISLPDSLEIIGNWAFNHCHYLKRVKINESCKLENIGKYAFCGTLIESIVFPSTLSKVGQFAFYECSMLKTVDNHSNEIKFKTSCFESSSIENIKFPSKCTFSKCSFKNCKKLKQLTFLEEPKHVIFGECSFAFSGLEKININYDSIIKNNAFMYCEKLNYAEIHSKCSTFYNSNIKELILDQKISYSKKSQLIGMHNHVVNVYSIILLELRSKKVPFEPSFFNYFQEILLSNIEKASLKLEFVGKHKNQKTFIHEFYLNDNCYVVNNTLLYANMIDNIHLYDKRSEKEDEIKNNEIIHVPNIVKKLDFPCMAHIKKIDWGTNCIVEDLGPPGFFSYYNLTQIVIPKLVKIIPSNLFEHNHFLESVEFEKDSILESIGDFAFAHARIKKITFPDTVQKLGKSALYDNKFLTEVVFNGEFIGDEAFANTGITSFKLSNSTKKIGSGAFEYCHSLKKFDIDIERSNLSEIGQYAFYETSIDEIKIPSKVKIIKKFTFNGCKCLKEVLFADNSELRTIQNHSFSGDLSLEKINLPKTITKLSYEAFINTPCLKSIMNESNQNFNLMEDNSVYKKDWSLIFVPRTIGQFKIDQKCPIIHSGSFCGPNLNEVIFPHDSLLTNIEHLSFAHCTGLKEIKIPNSVEKLGNECFIGCENLEKVEFESQSKIKEIPKLCFAFSGLQHIELPKSIEIINHSSFLFCRNLKSINLHDTKINYIGEFAFSETGIEEIKFPSSLRFIGNNSFTGQNTIKIIDFSEITHIEEASYENKKKFEFSNKSHSICYVDERAFSHLYVKMFKFNLNKYCWFSFFDQLDCMEEYLVNDDIHLVLQKSKKIEKNKINYDLIPKTYEIIQMKWLNQDFIPVLYHNSINEFFVSKTVNFLRPYNFLNYSNLEKIEFEYCINIQSIPKNCFSYIPLKKITIPDSVCVIKKSAFFDCSELEEVDFSSKSKLETIEESAFCKCIKLTKINLPSNCKIISRNCFSFTGLKSIEIPSSIKKIEFNTFYNCKELSNVILNNGLLEICESSFAFNSSLKSIDLPDSLTTIKSRAFYKCINLKKVNTTEKTELIEIEDESFDSTQIEELSINQKATKLFDPINMPNLNKINFYNGKPLNFIQFEDGSIYEKNDKIKDSIQSSIPELEEKMNKNLFISAISSNSYCSKTYISYKEIMPKDITKDQILLRRNLKLGFDILLKRNRLNDRPLLNLLFIPNNLKILKIHEDCFSMSKSIVQRISNLTTIEYLKGSTNYVFNIPYISSQSSKNLKNIKIMGDYSYIQEGTFSQFKSIEKVEFGPQTNISIIQKNSFLGCEKLQQISIPSSCISIEEGAFKNCISLVSVHLSSNLKYIRKEAFFNCSSLKSIEIPSTVLTICEGAFMNCTKLQNVEISVDEKGLELIGKSAFRNCTSLKSFVLPKTVLILGPLSFMNCKNLEKFEYEGQYLLSIQCRTFFNCISLKSIKMKNINYINNYVDKNLVHLKFLYHCWNKKIDFDDVDINEDTMSPFDSFKYMIKSSIFSIEAEAFMNCISLTDVIIEDKSKEIDTIKNNKRMIIFPIHDIVQYNKKCNLPYDLITVRQTIQRKAFYNCKSLQHVSLFLGNLEKFDDDAFSNCSSLKTIDINTRYSYCLLNDKLNMKSFCNTSNELVIKLFNRDECIKIINVHNSLK